MDPNLTRNRVRKSDASNIDPNPIHPEQAQLQKILELYDSYNLQGLQALKGTIRFTS